MVGERAALVRKGLLLNYATLSYNALEAVVAIIAALLSGSVALLGFGLDSVVEVGSSVTAQWRLRADVDAENRARADERALRIIGVTFLMLAAYVTYDSVTALWNREAPEGSLLGLAVLVLSVLVMPWLAYQRKQVARQLGSRALEADAKQTSLCVYLSVIALVGVGLNSVFGYWWADSLAALGMVPIIAHEGIEAMRGERCDDDR
jgi:divalent metal cation (Fe/Co/Zn/Cd) transporter